MGKEVNTMLDPLTFSLKVQHAAAIAGCCAAGVMIASWARFLRGERVLFSLPFHRRSDELHTAGDSIPKGATWSDHYGRRSHDVDVEHMR
jgi:hypothetical protein